MTTELQGEKYYYTFINNLPPSYRVANTIFAYYAAHVTLFNPEMLYELRHKNLKYSENGIEKELPFVVVADLLNSRTCWTVAFKVYELDEDLAKFIKSNIAELLKPNNIKFNTNPILPEIPIQ